MNYYITMKTNLDIFLHQFSRILYLSATAVFIFTMMADGTARADIYKHVDNEGVLHLTNVPSDPNVKYVMIMREKRILFQPNIDVTRYDSIISRAADKFNLDSALIKAVIKAESNFNHRAVSPVGAQGLMQLMPKTASSLSVDDSFHPEKNIEGGARYLSYLLKTYKGDLNLALAAYNAGEKAVAKYHYNIPPYRETQNYVKRVLSFYKSFSN
ncbi:MAG: lytic transglycosylase [Deltaproteobacteria bacterium HGW-Deltaproteobacteria-13]|nr:MAG: lytic transglycosylase [Deltaproteobacteria bacterium HGW-Deltaproteobacteria-13]